MAPHKEETRYRFPSNLPEIHALGTGPFSTRALSRRRPTASAITT
jgi:hypothetical protein